MASKEQIDYVDKCDGCGSTKIHFDYDRGETVCSRCGLVLEQMIDLRPPREFGEGVARGHHGDATRDRTDLGTEISSDMKGVTDTGRMHRLRRLQKQARFKNGVDRSMKRADPIIKSVASRMDLSENVVNESKIIYKKAIKKSLIRGRSIDCVVAASLYAACRKLNVSRTLDEFSEDTGIDRKNIGRTYRFLSQKLRLNLGLTNPEEYTMRFCSRLKLSEKVCMKSQEIIRRATELEMTSGKGPTGITAASIYIASTLCHENRTQRDIAEVSGVTEVTIRNRYRELTQVLNIEIAA